MIYHQIYRRAALTSFDVDPQVYRSLSLASRASARSVVRTAPKKGHREALHCSSFIGRQIPLPNRILVNVLRRSYHTITPYIPTAEARAFTALFGKTSSIKVLIE